MQALSRFFISAMLQTDPVLDVVRRELRRMSPDVRIDNQQIRDVRIGEVLKREVLEGDKAEGARKKLARSVAKVAKAKAGKPLASVEQAEGTASG